MADDQWFYKDNDGMVKGPVSRSELLQMASKKSLPKDVLVSSKDSNKWLPLSSIEKQIQMAIETESKRANKIKQEKASLEKSLVIFGLDLESNIEDLESRYQEKIKQAWAEQSSDRLMQVLKEYESTYTSIKTAFTKRDYGRRRVLDTDNLPMYYKILGLDENATLRDVQKAYDFLLDKYNRLPEGNFERENFKIDNIRKAYSELIKHIATVKHKPVEVASSRPMTIDEPIVITNEDVERIREKAKQREEESQRKFDSDIQSAINPNSTTATSIPVSSPKNKATNWYLEVLKKYAVFRGRARRKEYWYFLLFNTIIINVLPFVDYAIGTVDLQTGIGHLRAIYFLCILIPSIAVTVRRLHDTGRSGKWVLLPFAFIILLFFILSLRLSYPTLYIMLLYIITFMFFILVLLLIVFMLLDGTPGDNQYGPSPKPIKKTKSAPISRGMANIFENIIIISAWSLGYVRENLRTTILVSCSVALVIMAAFPPWDLTVRGITIRSMYSFIFYRPVLNGMEYAINFTRLFVQMLIVFAAGALVYYLFRDKQE